MSNKRQRSLDIPLGFTDEHRARLIAKKMQIKLTRAGGYDPRKGPNHPDNFDPTLEEHPTVITNLHQQRRIENAAILTHEVNRAYCTLIGDTSQVPWADAPQWQRDSAIDGITKIYKLEVTEPGDSHAAWLEHKKADGWTWGEVKDPEKKTHPSMKPFAELSRNEQLKDHLFVAVGAGALRAYGPRTVYAEKTVFSDITVNWKALEPYMTLGMFVICGRMGIVFDAAMRAYDRFDGYPVPEKDTLNRFADMTNTCMALADVPEIDGETPGDRGIMAMQKIRWPQRIVPSAHDTFAWAICHRIVHTIMWIEGVESIPKAQKWYRMRPDRSVDDADEISIEMKVAVPE